MYARKTKLLFNNNTRGNKKLTETIFMHPIVLSNEVEEKQTRKKLDAIILAAIDEGLSLFGDSVKKVVYSKFEKNYHLGRQDIPGNIEKFVVTVEAIFGVGAGLVEMKILKTLHARAKGFTYFPDGADFDFKDYVQSVRSFLGTSVNL